MSAHAYIRWADVPQALINGSRQRVDGATQAKLISFNGCPVIGEIEEQRGALVVGFPFPKSADIHGALVLWLMYWGISFTVVM